MVTTGRPVIRAAARTPGVGVRPSSSRAAFSSSRSAPAAAAASASAAEATATSSTMRRFMSDIDYVTNRIGLFYQAGKQLLTMLQYVAADPEGPGVDTE
jgi:hypothetical protein